MIHSTLWSSGLVQSLMLDQAIKQPETSKPVLVCILSLFSSYLQLSFKGPQQKSNCFILEQILDFGKLSSSLMSTTILL
ncbi:hypothetical protein NC653_019819 [Populus alba x Populus x berolinensis]|uniref:Uncharacterized protein n=1 Tax=Populus alba x Populus x berolinensis TaxID=444605 RepID=A0AAD6QBR6_9ROSI|nr:hypothetical protein NC653_019819 [Populus alba x Populus x berolinensis]